MPKFCSLCGHPLQDKGLSFKSQFDNKRSLTICPDCVRIATRCPLCHTPIHSSRENTCPACGADFLRCQSCEQIIPDRYVKIGQAGPFCQTCYQTYPACASCGAPVGANGHILPDNRSICPTCHQTAVYDEKKARALFEQVKRIIDKTLGLSLNIPTPIYLADRHQIKAIATQTGRAGDLIPRDQSLGLYLRQGRRRGIYVLYGLPETLTVCVMAHEYAHAWQAEHNPIRGESLLWEGFAEWVAYKTQVHLGHTEVIQQMVKRPDIYGQGLRRILEIEQNQGIEGVLVIAQRKRRL